MSDILRASGNLIDLAQEGEFNVIVHGCNCFNTMGSGIAKEIRTRIPTAWAADQKTRPGDYDKLGNYTSGHDLGFITINAYTQYDFNRPGEKGDKFEYLSFELILQKLAYYYSGMKFGFPYIGMGLAGGNKERILELLEDFAECVTNQGGSVTLVEFKK